MSFLRRRGVIASAGFAPIVATGGDTVFDEEIAGVLYRIHLFTTVGSSDAFEVQSLGDSDGLVEYLVIAGGGSGGSYTGAAYVGGNPGSNSVFGSITSQGGGGGRAWNVGSPNPNGGSSGGGGGNTTAAGTPTTGQGFSGGTGTSSGRLLGGGGGGAGGVGANASNPNNGNGGIGVESLITGVATFRGGGGGGGAAGSAVRGDGGLGGGGNGGINAAGQNGAANTGGGGGSGDNGVGAGHGGGGAGGYRCSVVGEQSGGGAPAEARLTVTETTYPVTVGAGGPLPGSFASVGGSGIVIVRYPLVRV